METVFQIFERIGGLGQEYGRDDGMHGSKEFGGK